MTIGKQCCDDMAPASATFRGRPECQKTVSVWIKKRFLFY